MALDPVAEKLGSLTQSVKNLNEKLEAAERSRTAMWEQLREIQNTLAQVTAQLKQQDEVLATLRPHVEQFAALQMRAEGAGWLGRWVWAIGGFVIATAAWLVNTFGSVRFK